MTDEQKNKAQDSQGSQRSRTIHIDVPEAAIDGMLKMMSDFSGSERTEAGCCGMTREMCCPQAGDSRIKELTVVIRRKG